MYRHLFAFCLIFSLSFNAFSQDGKITQNLNTRIQESESEFIPVRLEFTEKIDCFSLNLEFKQDQTPVDERPQIVIQSLINQSDYSQTPIRDFLELNYSDQYQNLRSFWIANILILECTPEVIVALSEIDEIAIIDFENNKFVPFDEVEISHGADNSRSEDGVEPGLEAINAPAMWAMGYTGRGRLVYDYDTGVWPMHPAFADRYMGNFFPTGQSWYGYHFDLPSGHINSHGTHTLGTIAGLIEDTNDTIGVAFNAYWLANDYVEQTVAELLPITQMITAFEWALNPDGDISTSYDIPDVISNSWRWYDENDQLHCEEGFVVDIMNAIEAAGIANVFSAGNFGPSNESISSPQRINTSEVNTFTVGSVNATNFEFPYPISNFSSHGPTQCPGEGSLEIYPEVVAPGQNVRSAWLHNEFNTISGTSMATPHVSGAILLLKEAFPYLSGEDLLWALYLTAIDLGEEGEDNIYGMGMIDVYEAFLYLSETNIPIDPNAIGWDLELTTVSTIHSGNYTCLEFVSPQIVVTNRGLNVIEEISFDLSINGEAVPTLFWLGSLEFNETVNVDFPPELLDGFGDVELNFVTRIVGISDEYDIYNNRRIVRFERRSIESLPFQEGFEAGFVLNDWNVENVDQFTTWDIIETEGLDAGNYSASLQYFDYSPRENQLDAMVSPEIIIPSDGNTTLKFDRSYPKAQSNPGYRDTLRVFVSTDCGATWPNVVFEKFSFDLSTMDTLVGDFVPEFDTHWVRDSVDLSTFSGENILLKFEGTNRKGNNLYIDNINIYNGDVEPVGVGEKEVLEVSIWPVPAHNFVELRLNSNLIGEEILILNINGQIVKTFIAKSEKMILQIDDLSVGTYFLSTVQKELNLNIKFIKY